MYNVFLSSTSRDLAGYREAVRQALDGLPGFQLVMMEAFGARDANAKDLCAQLVRDSDLLVGLMGHYYGSCPPGETISFTEVEYRGAAGSARFPHRKEQEVVGVTFSDRIGKIGRSSRVPGVAYGRHAAGCISQLYPLR